MNCLILLFVKDYDWCCNDLQCGIERSNQSENWSRQWIFSWLFMLEWIWKNVDGRVFVSSIAQFLYSVRLSTILHTKEVQEVDFYIFEMSLLAVLIKETRISHVLSYSSVFRVNKYISKFCMCSMSKNGYKSAEKLWASLKPISL